MTTRTCFFIFAAGLALVAVTNAETTPEESFSEATAFVQSFAAEGGDDSACAKVADDSIREVETECTTLQNEVDRRAKGDQVCCAAGKKAACHAKWRMDKAGNLVKNCKKAVKDAAGVRITGGVTLKQLKRKSSCLSSIKDNSNYAQVAAALKKEKRECEKKKGAKKALKKSYDDFVKDSDKQRKKCHDKTVRSAKKAFKQAKKACESDANKKAYARAMHMKCVLAGTSLKDCKKVKNPTLKETKMKAVKGYCKHVSMNCPAPTPAPTPKPTGTPTSAPTSTPTSAPTPRKDHTSGTGSKDCTQHLNSKCYAAHEKYQIDRTYGSWPTFEAKRRGKTGWTATLEGSPCGYGKWNGRGTEQMRCMCQYRCQQNAKCKSFTTLNINGGAYCKLYRRNCARQGESRAYGGTCTIGRRD